MLFEERQDLLRVEICACVFAMLGRANRGQSPEQEGDVEQLRRVHIDNSQPQSRLD
jgi:hypothetical protein